MTPVRGFPLSARTAQEVVRDGSVNRFGAVSVRCGICGELAPADEICRSRHEASRLLISGGVRHAPHRARSDVMRQHDLGSPLGEMAHFSLDECAIKPVSLHEVVRRTVLHHSSGLQNDDAIEISQG
jgi:hypothetical protein